MVAAAAVVVTATTVAVEVVVAVGVTERMLARELAADDTVSGRSGGVGGANALPIGNRRW
jgi:hypothetical protein